eukprot:TRINITY_DN58935_c0_g1_i1.p3 TRINITY_DN58935_c0_g1~~TRINITY_DN58935_c0_g1_i1.p3  ORF type:complete len:300 (-),score=-11.20 TRINITY_DN58935_c0_g1_i1:230-1129(-)
MFVFWWFSQNQDMQRAFLLKLYGIIIHIFNGKKIKKLFTAYLSLTFQTVIITFFFLVMFVFWWFSQNQDMQSAFLLKLLSIFNGKKNQKKNYLIQFEQFNVTYVKCIFVEIVWDNYSYFQWKKNQQKYIYIFTTHLIQIEQFNIVRYVSYILDTRSEIVQFKKQLVLFRNLIFYYVKNQIDQKNCYWIQIVVILSYIYYLYQLETYCQQRIIENCFIICQVDILIYRYILLQQLICPSCFFQVETFRVICFKSIEHNYLNIIRQLFSPLFLIRIIAQLLYFLKQFYNIFYLQFTFNLLN